MKFKLSERVMREIEIFWNTFFLMLGLFLIFFGLYFYMVAEHNTDLTLNLMLVTNDMNAYFFKENVTQFINFRNATDVTAGFKVVNFLNNYIYSSTLQLFGMIFMVLGSLLFGMYLISLVEMVRKC